ncbi:hypothetical protein A8926_6268 [Saccharopolyspora spinosa]|uniref:Uncharacterized protein n=1 Tax=Saccharopolyspora spinosa TaxID=60894 RepID=A0A2N3Y5I9_SACSN|nr:hypothetical protein A8926_6268 [Saccharopolyspora spinosa]
MIAALIATSLLGVGGFAVWATFYYAPARHGGGGEGALKVAYLVARVEAEARGRGRHRLREPVVRVCPDFDCHWGLTVFRPLLRRCRWSQTRPG